MGIILSILGKNHNEHKSTTGFDRISLFYYEPVCVFVLSELITFVVVLVNDIRILPSPHLSVYFS